MNIKRILIVASEFPPLPGGIGNHAVNLATSLQNRGFEVTVLTDQREEGFREFEYDSGLDFKVVRTLLYSNRKKMYFKRIQQLFKLCSVHDVLIASGKFSLWIVAFASFFHSKKTIAVVHGTEVNLKSNILKRFTNYSLQKIQVVVSVSNFTHSLTDHLKIKKSIIIPNGYHIENHELVDKKYKTFPNLVTVGRVSDRKGQINVIKALPLIKRAYPNVCYRMIGIPEDKNALIKLANKLGVVENIIFYGKQTYDELYSIVASSDIFMMLSQNDKQGDVEGFGIAILEANYFGIPAIGSLGCGIEDAIKNRYSGVLVNPQNKNDVYQALNDILKQSLFFSKQAKQWSSHFVWSKIINKYIEEL